jgi:hypothetical protein
MEAYDGKSYNLKTEKYENCECVEKLPQFKDLIKQSQLDLLERVGEVIGRDENAHMDTPNPNEYAFLRNKLRAEQREALLRIKEEL